MVLYFAEANSPPLDDAAVAPVAYNNADTTPPPLDLGGLDMVGLRIRSASNFTRPRPTTSCTIGQSEPLGYSAH